MNIQNIMNYFQTPAAQIKTAVGTCIGSAVSAYFGPLSWMGIAMIHLGTQAVAHGADPLVDRCRQLFARPVPAVAHRVNLAALNGGRSEEEALRIAAEESLLSMPDDIKLYEEAKVRSLYGDDGRFHHSSTHCALGDIGGSESVIDSEFTVQSGQQSFHLFSLVFSLLSQTNMQNPFTREPISEETVFEIAANLGINPDEFKNIWALSTMPGIGPTHHVPETEADLKTDFRFQLLENMLKSKDGAPSQIRTRERMLALLSQESVWFEQMRKPKLPLGF